jgi:hypothetical protein
LECAVDYQATAPTMAISLSAAQVRSLQIPVQKYQLNLSLAYNIVAWIM